MKHSRSSGLIAALAATVGLSAVRAGLDVAEPYAKTGDRDRLDRAETSEKSAGDAVGLAKAVGIIVKKHQLVFLAAGLAFYAMLAAVPALIAFVSIYGLVADPADVTRLVAGFSDAVPAEVSAFVESQLSSITTASGAGLGVSAVISIVAALWSASSGTKAMVQAINLIHGIDDTRGFAKARGLALALTIGLVAFVVVAVALLTIVPSWFGDGAGADLVGVLRWPVLALVAVAGLLVLYRVAPSRQGPTWKGAAAGAAAAAVVWLAASVGLTIYASSFGSFNETYGTLGAVVVLLLWFYLSGIAVLLGAALNHALDRRRRGLPVV